MIAPKMRTRETMSLGCSSGNEVAPTHVGSNIGTTKLKAVHRQCMDASRDAITETTPATPAGMASAGVNGRKQQGPN